MITKAYLRKKFVYRNGNLYRRGGDLRKKIGCHIKSERYVKVKIDSKNYYLHRLIWIYHYGQIKEKYQIDHIDRNKRNNRIQNLRSIKPKYNVYNRTIGFNKVSSGATGATGIYWSKSKRRYIVGITKNKKKYYLGSFTRKADAIKARKSAERDYHNLK